MNIVKVFFVVVCEMNFEFVLQFLLIRLKCK